jgi:transcription termination/antitermination protein NusG
MTDEPGVPQPPEETNEPAPAATAVAVEPEALADAPEQSVPTESEADLGKPPAEPTTAEEAVPPAPPPPPPSKKHWYVVKVQSGREESIKDAIERRVKIEGLEEFFGQIVIPVEKVVEMRHMKDGKTQRVTRSRKLYPGYLMVEVEYNDRILYLFRETSGVGDFVGAGGTKEPTPMPAHEIQRITNPGKQPAGPAVTKITYEKGDRVKVKKGPFAGMEGEVKEILEAKDKVRIELTIFGRAVPVELEFWDVERV